jgi:hypothetical protein
MQLRLLRQEADLHVGHRHRFAVEVLVLAGHDAQQARLAGAIQPSTPILAPGKKLSEMSLRITRFGGTVLLTRRIV